MDTKHSCVSFVDSLYHGYPELATAEEREGWETFPTLLRCVSELLKLPIPEAWEMRAWEARKPALGLTTAQLSEIEQYDLDPDRRPVERRQLFQSL